jgi:hypothetical protein
MHDFFSKGEVEKLLASLKFYFDSRRRTLGALCVDRYARFSRAEACRPSSVDYPRRRV